MSEPMNAPAAPLAEALELAASRPAGPERLERTRRAVEIAVAAGDEAGEVAARLALISASLAVDPWGAVEPFLWCVARRRQRPDLFTAEQSRELGEDYLWVGIVAASNPTIPAAQVRVLEQGVSALAGELGLSEHALEDQRRIIALDLGQRDEAHEALERWRRAPRDAHQCAACEVQRAVDDACQRGEWEEAVRYAVPVLTGALSCDDQPTGIEGLILVALVRTGRLELAWRYHLRAYLADRAPDADPGWVREHLAYLALTGQVHRGLAILRRHAGRTAQCLWTSDILELVTGMVVILRAAVRAGLGAERLGVDVPRCPLGLGGHEVGADATLAEALEITGLWLDAMCTAFDERNGNHAVSDEIRAFLDLEPVTDAVVTEPRLRLVRDPEALPEPLPTSLVEDDPLVPAGAPRRHGAGGASRAEEALPAEVASVDLERRERVVNDLLAQGDTTRAARALTMIAWDLRQAGRDLEALTAVELGLELQTAPGRRHSEECRTVLDLHRQALGALGALQDHRGVMAAASACADASRRAGDPAGTRLYLEIAAVSALRSDHPLSAAQFYERAADVRLDDAEDGGLADLLGRERYLRRAARALIAFSSPTVRRGQSAEASEVLDRAAEVVDALRSVADDALADAEADGLEADRALVDAPGRR